MLHICKSCVRLWFPQLPAQHHVAMKTGSSQLHYSKKHEPHQSSRLLHFGLQQGSKIILIRGRTVHQILLVHTFPSKAPEKSWELGRTNLLRPQTYKLVVHSSQDISDTEESTKK
jgi:hypothetical protein